MHAAALGDLADALDHDGTTMFLKVPGHALQLARQGLELFRDALHEGIGFAAFGHRWLHGGNGRIEARDGTFFPILFLLQCKLQPWNGRSMLGSLSAKQRPQGRIAVRYPSIRPPCRSPVEALCDPNCSTPHWRQP